jgi:hypothetical protein
MINFDTLIICGFIFAFIAVLEIGWFLALWIIFVIENREKLQHLKKERKNRVVILNNLKMKNLKLSKND